MSHNCYLTDYDRCMFRSKRRSRSLYGHLPQIWNRCCMFFHLRCHLLQKNIFNKISHSNDLWISDCYNSMLVYKDFCRSESKISRPTNWYFFIIFIFFIGTCFFFYEKFMSKMIFLVLVQGLKCDLNIQNFIVTGTLVLKVVSCPVLFIDVLFQDTLLY